jgi:hypothetical protein
MGTFASEVLKLQGSNVLELMTPVERGVVKSRNTGDPSRERDEFGLLRKETAFMLGLLPIQSLDHGETRRLCDDKVSPSLDPLCIHQLRREHLPRWHLCPSSTIREK